ncbi:MAG: NYN domain-containing protein [Lachnospiraceae bacterium]|nr:NYN domain-containing protein [Lachnospiraceae bacterium]
MRRMTIGILAHVDAGKTTLSESLLFVSGAIQKQGRVDHKDTVLDNNDLERKRGITIFSKLASFSYGETIFTLLDTPGHVDFSAEMERSLQVLDVAILVVSATAGIQGHTKTLAALLKKNNVPTFVFVNKTDMPGLDKNTIMASLSGLFDGSCVRFDVRGDDFGENVAMSDEHLLERYLEGEEPTEDDIRELIATRRLIPVYFGAALKNQGVGALLEGLTTYTKPHDYGEEFGARVYKIARDDRGVRLTFLKMFGGTLAVKDTVTHADGTQEKVEQIREYSGASYKNVNECERGAIYAVCGLNASFSGEGLGVIESSSDDGIVPIFTYSVSGDGSVDDKIVLGNLKLLEEEDPSLHVSFDERLREIHISLMGDVMLEIISSIYEGRFGHKIYFKSAGIVYKESIRDTVIGVGHYEPLRHYGEVHLLMQPMPKGSGVVINSELSVDVLAISYQKQILNALANKIHLGVLTGAPLTDIKLTLVAGRAHEKHTEGGDLREAALRAVRQGLMKAKSVLLEPEYTFELNVPQAMTGRAMTDINKLGGTVLETLSEGDMALLTGTAPAAAIHDYQKEVNIYTSGTGSISFKLSGYIPCADEEAVLLENTYDPLSDLENKPDSVFCSHGAGFVVPWEEVDAYSHVKAYAYSHLYMDHAVATEPETEGRASKSKLSGSDELDEIFRRTFGESKRDRYNYNAPKVIEAPKNPAVKEYKPNSRIDKRSEQLVVDGYNVIYADRELSELMKTNQDSARDKLLDILHNYQGYTGKDIIIVFDAYNVKGKEAHYAKYGPMKIVFSRGAQTADMYIENYVSENRDKFRITVASSDALIQMQILSQGALRMSSAELLEQIRAVNKEIKGKVGE